MQFGALGRTRAFPFRAPKSKIKYWVHKEQEAMAVRRLLVPVSHAQMVRPRLRAAVAIARACRARIDVLHVRAIPQEAVPLLGEGISGAMIQDLVSLAESEAALRAEAVRDALEVARKAYDVPFATASAVGPVAIADGPSLTWTDVVGHEADETVWRGHLSDLIVLGRAEPEADDVTRATLNSALFESGRPVLVVPPDFGGAPAANDGAEGAYPVPELGRHVAVAWTASAESTRALAAALPFLARARLVVILSAPASGMAGTATEESGPTAAAGVVDYLALHGIEARVGTVPEAGGSVGSALLDAAVAAGADLIVMGAYTHGRLYEMILGGVTRHVLERSMIPLLMAH